MSTTRPASRNTLLRPLEFMLWIGYPLVSLMEAFCERLKSRKPVKSSSSDHIMDIITLVQAAKAEQVIHNREEIIIIHAATLSARRVRSVMVPASAVKVFDIQRTLRENVANAGDKVHRSYPVSSDGTLESVQGYARVRELFVDQLLAGDPADWQKRIRPVLRIPGKSSLTQLLAAFLENREIAAVVCADDGSPVGWVTLDDVTETLMGAR